MPVATLAQLKLQLNITTSTHDGELQDYVDAATAQVEYLVGGPTVVQSFTEQHASAWGLIALRRKPTVAITSVTPKDQPALPAANYVLDPDANTICIARGGGAYTVVYTSGWATVPADMRLAGLIIAQHLWQTQNGGGGLPFPGDDQLVTVGGAPFAIPYRAADILKRFGTPAQIPGIA